MQGKLITVVGGSGFIGRHIVRLLAKEGARVRVAVRDPEAAMFLKPMGDVGQVVPVLANITHMGSIQRAVEGADAVVNLVGILFESGHQTFEGTQTDGPQNIAQAAAAAGVGALVHLSAIGADPKSKAKYAKTKGLGEAAIQAGFPTATILRPSIVFGPEDGFFNRFGAMTKWAPVLPLIGGGLTKFQPVYVADVAKAAVAALKDPDTHGGKIYELGGPRQLSFADLLDYIRREVGRPRLPLVPVPWQIARVQGAIAGVLPNPPLTLDQVKLLENDNVVSDGALGLDAFGIDPVSFEAIVPTYMGRYHKDGYYKKTVEI